MNGYQFLASASGLQSFGSDYQGKASRNYRVQASSDLVRWLNLLTTNLTSNSSFSFTDTNASRFSQRFYRVVTVP